MHFLVGPAAAVGEIAAAVGFPYRYDKVLDQYIHPAGFVVASGNGRISSYVEGVAVTPAALTAALAAAEQNAAPGPFARLLLLCRGGSALLGRYTVPVLAAFTLADLAAMIAVIAVFAAIRRRRHG